MKYLLIINFDLAEIKLKIQELDYKSICKSEIIKSIDIAINKNQ